jgi:hypothetical protein
MRDKQNAGLDNDESSPTRDEETTPQESGRTPRSYYYDDATGYEIYEEETDTGEEAEDPDEEGR